MKTNGGTQRTVKGASPSKSLPMKGPGAKAGPKMGMHSSAPMAKKGC